ncbi:MAG: PAS domain-containing protein [Treponema sp.]|nr:PAS domain-containing protein [Treponema sp.]
MDIMDIVARMVSFLGKTCGEHCEVVLQDLRDDKRCIAAIANGHVSGRSVGSPLTDLSMKLVNQGIWKTQDYVCNYTGKTPDNRILHSSTFFIKHEGALLGMLSINIDTTKYVQLSEGILNLVGMTSLAPQPAPGLLAAESQAENFYENIEEIVRSVLLGLGITETPKEPFSPEERLAILEGLLERGVFLLRGSVSAAAAKLRCSEPELYRSISFINRRKAQAGKGGHDGSG